MNEIRKDYLTNEWVIIAPNRSNRPVSPSSCPFCPTSPEVDPSKRVQIVPNRYPSLSMEAPVLVSDYWRTAHGVSEIVVETLEHNADFAYLPLDVAVEIFQVALNRLRELASKPEIEYVHFFRNRGKTLGVSIAHPHSQIYALPFTPPRLRREAKVFQENSDCVLCTQLSLKNFGDRLIYRMGEARSYVPYAPKIPYEFHIQTTHTESLWSLGTQELRDVVNVLQSTLKVLDLLLGSDAAYTFAVHNSPKNSSKFHAHIEVIPFITDRKLVRFSTGLERTTGACVLDGLPEERARELRAVLGGIKT
jgi:UDPglucose--hexose-1-phosphate uridylyltransferase